MAIQVEHPSAYILEEMDERGWDRDLLAVLMVAGTGDRAEALKFYTDNPHTKELQLQRLELDFYFEIGAQTPNMRLGECAAKFGQVFGTSEDLFLNLERAWLSSLEAR